MQDENEQILETTSNKQPHASPDQPCCSYSPPKSIMKSTPRMEKIIDKIWKQPNHEEVITLVDSSTEDFPIQPPIRQIEVVFLDSSENTQNTGTQDGTQDNIGTQDNDGRATTIQDEITTNLPR